MNTPFMMTNRAKSTIKSVTVDTIELLPLDYAVISA